MGRTTGVEPATLGTTNQCSNQLSYVRHIYLKKQSAGWLTIYKKLQPAFTDDDGDDELQLLFSYEYIISKDFTLSTVLENLAIDSFEIP